MAIETLRNEIRELNEQIAHHRAEIEALEEAIEDAYAEISDKEAEIERLEAEDAAMDELRQIVNGGEIMGRDAADIRAIIDFIRTGIRPAPEETPSGVVEHTRTVVVSTETGEETEITPEMMGDVSDGYMTIVGTSHQDLWELQHYTPHIGDLVYLSKETITANCYCVLTGCEDVGGEDITIGILPTNAGSKPAELAEIGLPCVCHQDVWNTDKLDKTYEVVGAVPGKYVVIKPHITSEEPAPVEQPAPEPEPETTSSDVPIDEVISGLASTVNEAKRLFEANMPSTCTILDPVEDCGDWFKINYINHRLNDDPFGIAKVSKSA